MPLLQPITEIMYKFQQKSRKKTDTELSFDLVTICFVIRILCFSGNWLEHIPGNFFILCMASFMFLTDTRDLNMKRRAVSIKQKVYRITKYLKTCFTMPTPYTAAFIEAGTHGNP